MATYIMETTTEQSIQYMREMFADADRRIEELREDYRFYVEAANNERDDDDDRRRIAGECAAKIKAFLEEIG